MNHFEVKIDELFARKRLQAATLKKHEDEPIQETKEQLKYLPFNVSTVIRQLEEETARRAKTLKSGVKLSYKDYNACESDD